MKKTLFILPFVLICSFVHSQILLKDLDISSRNSIIEFKGDMWVFGTSRYYDPDVPYSVLRSSDMGSTWEIMVPKLKVLNAHSKTVLFNGVLYSIAGHPKFFTNEVKISTDGISWDSSYTAPFSPRRTHAALVHNNKLFVIAGAGYNDVWFTENGRDWTRATSQLSSDFPHFWRAKAVSLNGKLILFGGDKTDWGWVNNERGVYVSTDDGYTWTRYEFPFSADLNSERAYFVYQNKLWSVSQASTYMTTPPKRYNREEKRFFTTADGINWQVEPNHEDPFIRHVGISTKTVPFQGEIYNFSEHSGVTKRVQLELPKLKLSSIRSILTHPTRPLEHTIPFKATQTNSCVSRTIAYDFTSSNQDVVACDGLRFANNQIILTATGKIGETTITVKASDGVNNYQEIFDFFMFPDEKVYVRNVRNQLRPEGSSDFGRLFLLRDHIDPVNSSTYSFTSSNNDFISPEDIEIFNFAILEIPSLAPNGNGESKITVKVTSDQNTSYSTSFWAKIGSDEAPSAVDSLQNYAWDTASNFDYQLPDSAFSDPENAPLSYSSNNLPCGLHIHEETGRITGTTDKPLPFTIKIIATDRYNKTAEHDLVIESRAVVGGDRVDVKPLERKEILSTVLQTDAKEESDLFFSPNPVSNDLHVSGSGFFRVSIYNTIGFLMGVYEFIDSGEVPFATFSTGIYLLIIESETEGLVKRVIVKQ